MNFLATITYFACFENVINEERYPIVNNLIVKVKESVWNDDENICVRETLDMLYGVKNRTLWATWAWDAMQSPVGVLYGTDYHFGNFDQCMKSPWPKPVLQYCLVDIDIGNPKLPKKFDPYGDTEEYLKTATIYGRPLTKQTFGVCLPSSCSPATTGKVYRLLHQLTYLVEGNVSVDPRDCQMAGKSRPLSVKFWVFWGTIAGLITLVIASTCHDVFGKNHKGLITKSFSFKSNFQELLKTSDGDIKVMNGMRFFTAAAVVVMHEHVVTFILPLINTMDTDMILGSWHGKILSNSSVAVDTFVAMSGLLLAKSFFSGPNKGLIVNLLKRYIRLIGPYAIITFYYISSVYEAGDGPFWFRGLRKEAEPCENYWWKNFLMINNDITTICHSVSWYIPCDYQLAVLSTIMFFIYRRNEKIGLTAFFAVGTVLTVKYGWVIYSKKLSILPFENAIMFANIQESVKLNEMYFNIESRILSYFVGVFMGYIIAVYKPNQYRNSISKTISAVILLSSLTILLILLCLGYLYSLKSYSAPEVAVIVALHRGVWALAICGIIAVAEYGCANYITNFLEQPLFRPLSKLSYGIYLVHMVLIQINLARTRNPLNFNFYTVTINSLGILNVSCAASFMIYIIIEAPLITISNELFKEKKQDVINNEMKSNNTQNGKSKIL